MDSMTGIIVIMLLAILSFLALWKPNPLLFMILTPLAIIIGLSAPDIISDTATTTGLDITVALVLISYGFLCAAWSFRMLFWRYEA